MFKSSCLYLSGMYFTWPQRVPRPSHLARHEPVCDVSEAGTGLEQQTHNLGTENNKNQFLVIVEHDFTTLGVK